MILKVIGAGFGRTGTDSMRMALSILGFGPTYHMFDLSDKPDLYKRWIDLTHGGPADWNNRCLADGRFGQGDSRIPI